MQRRIAPPILTLRRCDSSPPLQEKECREFGAHNFMIWNKDNAAYKSKFDIIINTASSDVSTTELMALLKVDGSLVQVRPTK